MGVLHPCRMKGVHALAHLQHLLAGHMGAACFLRIGKRARDQRIHRVAMLDIEPDDVVNNRQVHRGKPFPQRLGRKPLVVVVDQIHEAHARARGADFTIG